MLRYNQHIDLYIQFNTTYSYKGGTYVS